MAVATDPRLEEVRKITKGRGVEFFFAQFVDMYGRPSAKLVPAGNLDDLASELEDHRIHRHGHPPGSSKVRRSSRPSIRFIDWIA